MPVSGAPPVAGRLLQDLVQLAIYVVDLHAVRLRQQRDAVEHSLRNALLNENSIHQRERPDQDTDEVLGGGERHQLHSLAPELHDEDLAEEDADDNHDKEVVVGDVGEHIELVLLELAGVEEVEHLQEHEHVEEDAEVHTVGVVPVLQIHSDRALYSKQRRALEQDDAQDDDLEQRLEHDAPPHLGRDHLLVAGVRHAVEQLI